MLISALNFMALYFNFWTGLLTLVLVQIFITVIGYNLLYRDHNSEVIETSIINMSVLLVIVLGAHLIISQGINHFTRL